MTNKPLTYLTVFHKDNDGYSVLVPDLPGCYGFGKDMDNATELIKGAIGLHLRGMQRDKEAIPIPSSKLSDDAIDGGIVVPVSVYANLDVDGEYM